MPDKAAGDGAGGDGGGDGESLRLHAGVYVRRACTQTELSEIKLVQDLQRSSDSLEKELTAIKRQLAQTQDEVAAGAQAIIDERLARLERKHADKLELMESKHHRQLRNKEEACVLRIREDREREAREHERLLLKAGTAHEQEAERLRNENAALHETVNGQLQALKHVKEKELQETQGFGKGPHAGKSFEQMEEEILGKMKAGTLHLEMEIRRREMRIREIEEEYGLLERRHDESMQRTGELKLELEEERAHVAKHLESSAHRWQVEIQQLQRGAAKEEELLRKRVKKLGTDITETAVARAEENETQDHIMEEQAAAIDCLVETVNDLLAQLNDKKAAATAMHRVAIMAARDGRAAGDDNDGPPAPMTTMLKQKLAGVSSATSVAAASAGRRAPHTGPDLKKLMVAEAPALQKPVTVNAHLTPEEERDLLNLGSFLQSQLQVQVPMPMPPGHPPPVRPGMGNSSRLQSYVPNNGSLTSRKPVTTGKPGKRSAGAEMKLPAQKLGEQFPSLENVPVFLS